MASANAFVPSRDQAAQPPRVAKGWELEELTPPSCLFGANGLRAGPDGRLYIAECVGSRISALDVDTGALETISAPGSEIVGPDDLAFDAAGRLFVTECMDARVSVIQRDGSTRVLRDDLPGANGITFHHGRLFIDECRPGGRLMEIDPEGGSSRVLVDELPMPNALAPGPDGWLYYPLVADNEIWRVHPDEGKPERVAAGLGHPVAVKFDAEGNIVSPQAGTGEVLRIDPASGRRTVLARLDPCLDNLEFVGRRLFVSHFSDGRITEILDDMQSREILPGGLQFPLDLTVDADGKLYFADNCTVYALKPGAAPHRLGWTFQAGYPGSVRGLAALSDGRLAVTTSDGIVAAYRPGAGEYEILARDLDQPYGIAVGASGNIVVAECGAGRVVLIGGGRSRVLSEGLDRPTGVTLASDGSCLVSEAGAGRVVKLSDTGREILIDDLNEPQSLVVHDGTLYVVDAGLHALIAFDLGSKRRHVVAEHLPIGAPSGTVLKPLRGMPPLSGPFGPFPGLTAAPDGALYFSADWAGSIMALRRTGNGHGQ